jgi:ADP-glucose pyrophosphorylase
MLRIAAGHRVIFQLAEATGEGHVIGAGDFLVTQEYHSMLEQLGTNLGKQTIVVHGVGEVDADQFGANGGSQLFDFHGWQLLK